MTLHLTLPDDLTERLEAHARAAGKTPEQVAVACIRRNLVDGNELDAILAPVREAFAASGMTEDELTELLEAEKHAMRRERRAAGSP